MISCIICSRQPDISAELKENIASTIGCDYELVVIDNSNNEYSIFSAYNEGVRRAQGDIFCFIHEDIIFHSVMWGEWLQKHFEEDKTIGCLGILGNQYISEIPSPMWASSPMVMGDFIQGNLNNDGTYTTTHEPATTNLLTEVASVDGLFITIRKDLFVMRELRWDNVTFSGFHMYDMDICMQVLSLGYKVCVVPKILIEHKSKGTIDEVYYQTLNIFYDKWKSYLPVEKGITLTPSEKRWRTYLLEELYAYRNTGKQLSKIRCSKAYRIGKALLKPFSIIKKLKG